MRKSFIIVIGTFIGVAILVNILLNEPTFSTLTDKVNFELQANQLESAEKTLFQILQDDSLKIENHYRYINSHFNIPKVKKIGKRSYQYRDDNTIQAYYNILAKSEDSVVSDIGLYGKGLIYVNLEKYFEAISFFKQVKNKKLHYLNNSIGNAYNNIDSISLSEFYFRKEIENGGNLQGAYSNLIELLFDHERFEELYQYLNDPEIKKSFPSRIERAYYFKTYQPIKYTSLLIKGVFSGLNIFGAIAAFLILGVWTMYLRRLDIFEVEKWSHVIIIVTLGMFSSLITFPLTDFDNLFFNFKLNGGLINDLFYSVIGIGAIEEFVKIVPLILMMKFTKAVNEPFDYIKYASLSALGFAFVENLLYLNENSLHIIHGRALSSVVSHMFNSSLIAYGIILNKYKRYKNPYLNFLLFFSLASISHGFYDFWLLNKTASNFNFLTVLFLLSSVIMWNSFKNSALNHSNFYDKDKFLNRNTLQDYLLYSLASIFLLEYVILAVNFGPSVANSGFVSALYSGTYLIIFLSANLSQFSLNQGEWVPVNFWRTTDSNIFDNEERLNPLTFEKSVGIKFNLINFTSNEYQQAFLPNSGQIINRLTVNNEPDWYLIKLDTSKIITGYLNDLAILKLKDRGERIKPGQTKFIAFFIIPDFVNLDTGNLNRTDLKFCGWAKISALKSADNSLFT